MKLLIITRTGWLAGQKRTPNFVATVPSLLTTARTNGYGIRWTK